MLKAEFECRGLAVSEKALKYRERTIKREMELWNTSLTLVSRDICVFLEKIYCERE